MGDPKRGLYDKFNVRRTDGSSEPGGKHEHCSYFVLDFSHDDHAIPALEAYAASCRTEYPLLAADLLKLVRGARMARALERAEWGRDRDTRANPPRQFPTLAELADAGEA